jgi:hypothetical protein
MGFLPTSRISANRWPRATAVDWNNPLARNLIDLVVANNGGLAEITGRSRIASEDATPTKGFGLAAPIAPLGSPDGAIGWVCDESATVRPYVTTHVIHEPDRVDTHPGALGVAMFWRASRQRGISGQAAGRIFTGGSDTFQVRRDTSNTQWVLQYRDSTGAIAQSGNLTDIYDGFAHACCYNVGYVDGVPQDIRHTLWIDGVLEIDDTNTDATIPSPAITELHHGHRGGVRRDPGLIFSNMGMIRGVLSDADARVLSTREGQASILLERPGRVYFIPSGGGTTYEDAGSIDGSVDLTAAAQLTAEDGASLDASADLTAATQLTTEEAASLDVSADLTATGSVTAEEAGTLAINATLTAITSATMEDAATLAIDATVSGVSAATFEEAATLAINATISGISAVAGAIEKAGTLAVTSALSALTGGTMEEAGSLAASAGLTAISELVASIVASGNRLAYVSPELREAYVAAESRIAKVGPEHRTAYVEKG